MEEGGQGYGFQTVIKDFLRDDKKLHRDNEIILYCFCVVAVKFSVESSVESLISRYECHLFCATLQILSLNLSIYVLRTYEFNRIKPILHRQLFSIEKQGVFLVCLKNNIFPVKILNFNMFVAKSQIYAVFVTICRET